MVIGCRTLAFLLGNQDIRTVKSGVVSLAQVKGQRPNGLQTRLRGSTTATFLPESSICDTFLAGRRMGILVGTLFFIIIVVYIAWASCTFKQIIGWLEECFLIIFGMNVVLRTPVFKCWTLLFSWFLAICIWTLLTWSALDSCPFRRRKLFQIILIILLGDSRSLVVTASAGFLCTISKSIVTETWGYLTIARAR